MNWKKATMRILGMSLTASMMLSAVGCAKVASSKSTSTSESSIFTETTTTQTNETVPPAPVEPEPFYQAEVIPLKTHVEGENADSELKWAYAPIFVGDYVIFEEENYYNRLTDETTNSQIYDMNRWYFIFDLDGNQVGKIEPPGYAVQFQNTSFCMTRDNELVMCYATDSELGEHTIHLRKYTLSGERLQDSAFHDPWGSDIVGVTVQNDGSFIVVTSSSVFYVDKDCLDVEQVDFPDGDLCIGMYEEDGTYYAQMITMLGMGANYSCRLTAIVTPADPVADRDAHNLVGMKVFQNAGSVYAMTKNKLGRLSLKSGEFSQILDWNQTDIDRSLITQGDVKVVRDGTMAQPITLMDYTDLSVADMDDSKEIDVGQGEKRVDEERQYAELYVSTVSSIDDNEAVLIHFTKSDSNPSVGKKTIWVGGVDLANSGFSQFVVSYNARPESTAWIKLSDYSDFDSPYDFMKPILVTKKEDVVSQLYKQMLSGVGPDMLFGFADSPIFDKNEILIDLNPYLDGIRGIDRMEYFSNVFEAFCTGGKLYQLPLTFSIQGIMRNEELYDQSNAVTLNHILALIHEAGNKNLPCPPMPPSVIEKLFISNTLSQGVDYENGTVNYTHGDILSLLALMQEMENSDYTYTDDTPTGNRPITANGGTEGYYSTMSAYFDLADMYWGDVYFAPTEICNLEQFTGAYMTHSDAELGGYPLPSDTGYTAKAYYSVGIASYCSYKEEAWNFVSYLLSKDVQTEIAMSCMVKNMLTGTLPVNVEAFRELCRFEITVKLDWTHPGTSKDGTPVQYEYDLNYEKAEAFENMVSRITRRYLDDSNIHTIIQNHWYMINNGVGGLVEASESIIKEMSDYLQSRG